VSIPQASPESSRRILAADASNRAKWARVTFRDNRDSSTRRLPPHCGGCWCGAPNGHDWPGKDEGEAHPRD
jgi:hypothetical protein